MRKLMWLGVLVLAYLSLPQLAFGQNTYYENQVTGSDGRPVAGAHVAVCTDVGIVGTSTTPCAPLATIYLGATGSTAANPLTADGRGNFHFWAAPGQYTIQVYRVGIVTSFQPLTITCSPAGTGCGGGGGGSGTVTSITVGNLSPIFTTSVSSPTTAASLTFSASSAAANTVLGNCTGAPGPPAYCAITSAMLPGGFLTGSIATSQIGFGSSTNTVGGDALFTWDSTNHRAFIGPTLTGLPSDIVNVPSGIIDVFIQGLSSSTTFYPLYVLGQSKVAAGSVAPAQAGIFIATADGTLGATGGQSEAYVNPGMGQTVTTAASVQGNYEFAANVGDGTVQYMSGGFGSAGNEGSGVVQNAAGYAVWGGLSGGIFNTGAGSVTNGYDFYAGSQTVATNNYGFYVEDFGAGANNWGFYQAGTTAKSRFANVQLLALQFNGSTSGSASIGVAAVAGTPCTIVLPTVSPSAGQVLTAAAPSGGNCLASWAANGAATWSGLTAGANSNAGTFSATGNSWDFHGATHTLPVVSGAIGSIPATCTVGEIYFSTSATNGQNLYYCTSLNVFTQQLNSGAAGASTALSNLAAVAINTTLLPGAVNTVALGSNALSFTNLFVGTVANQTASYNTANLTANRAMNIPNATSTLVRDCPAISHNFLTAIAVATGSCTQAQPAIADLSDGASVLSASSTNTLTNKTFNAESTGNVLSEPIKAFFAAGGCNNSTAGPSMDLGTTNAPTPQCSGTTVRKGVLAFARGNVSYINFHLPKDWNSSAATDIELGFTTTDTTNGHVTSWNIQTACNIVDGTATDDPALNALQALSVTTGASQISGGMLVGTKTALTMTGCVADYNFEIAITRNNSGTDTNTDTAVGLKFAELTFGVSKNAANR